jgi:Fic family protein
MNYGDNLYIWQATDWPQWRYDLTKLAGLLAGVSRAQGLLMGRLADVGMTLRDQASLAALTDDVVKTSEPLTAMSMAWWKWCWMPQGAAIQH